MNGNSTNISSNISSDIHSDIGSKITTNSSQISSHLLWGLGAEGLGSGMGSDDWEGGSG